MGWEHPVAAVRRAHQENRELLAKYRDHFKGEDIHKSVTACLRAFETFTEVQGEFLSWFCDDPLGYLDLRKYCRDLFSLPLPPIYLECERGLPYSRSLHEGFDLESGKSVRVAELPGELKGKLPEYHDEDGFLNLWNLLSYRMEVDENSFASQVDFVAWREQARWAGPALTLVRPGNLGRVPFA
jgi:hypothetical protein